MRKLFFYVLIVLTTFYIGAAHAALPDWILPELKKYPIEKYLFQVGEGHGTGKRAFEEAVNAAHRRIASDILRDVDRVIRLNKSELQYDIVREHYSAVLEDYCDSRQAWPAMQLKGFHVRNLNVDLARKDPNTYAFVYIEREKLKQHYAEHVLELSKDINRLVESAEFAEGAYEIEFAVQKYLQTYPLYEALKEAEIIQVGAEYKYAINSTEAFKPLVEAATDTSSVLKKSHREVIKRIAELDKSRLVVFHEDIAKATEFQLSQQHSSTPRECWIEPLIYEDSQMPCTFEQQFSAALLRQLDWPIVKPPIHFKPTSPDLTRINRTLLPNRITASCWENGDEITIRTTARDPNTGNFLATAVVRFLKSQLREPIDLQPPNYKQMRAEIEPYDIPVIIGEELVVEVWTYQGRGPLRYAEDEKVKIFVQVNQPAYIRLLYTLADRRHTLLEDNYHIDAAQVNTAVEIGEFLCAAPFGPELLVAVARTEKFPDIEKRKEDGYFIIDGDPDSVRGLKVIPEPDPDPHPNGEPQPEPTFQQSEAQIVITTVAK